MLAANAAYRCDFFVHYYNMSHEVSGRSGIGGQLNPHEIRSLTDAVHQHTPGRVNVTVEYTVDEEEFFWKKFGVLLKRIHEKKDSHGKYIYYPWKARTYKVGRSDAAYCIGMLLNTVDPHRILFSTPVPRDRGQYCKNVAQYRASLVSHGSTRDTRAYSIPKSSHVAVGCCVHDSNKHLGNR